MSNLTITRAVSGRGLLLAALTLVCHACGSHSVAPPALKTASVVSPLASPPTVEELENMPYTGLDERLGRVTLENGRFVGDPLAPGAASRPTVEIGHDFRVVGDLDGDGLAEAVVALTYSPGGTAAWSFLAVVTRAGGMLRNVATTAIGDRAQVRSARIDGGKLIVNAVRAGQGDTACCPGEIVEWQWTLADGRLSPPDAVTTGRLSLSTLAGTTWVLRAWDLTDPAGSDPLVTVTYDAGRFTGTSGCNRYFAGVEEAGDRPGEMSVGPLAGTRMACPEPQSSVETRFLEQLGRARTFGFMLGRLAISYTRGDGSPGRMLFDASLTSGSGARVPPRAAP